MKLAIVFHRFGPYHKARIESLRDYADVHAVQLARDTNQYAWNEVTIDSKIQSHLVCPEGDSRELTKGDLSKRINDLFQEMKPDTIAVNGWADGGALASLRWGLKNKTPVVLMSESNHIDFRRRWAKEFLKRQILKGFSSALVGGKLAKDYAVELGMDPNSIFFGYDVVDNDHFLRPENIEQEDAIEQLGLERSYILSSNRFISKKNLPFLLHAYSKYRQQDRAPLDLVMLGGGPMESELEQLIDQLGISECVHRPGFKQYDQLPAYFHGASFFVHASTSEQWGLVINEAMAAGLPVVASNRCGSTDQLVVDGTNGFSFDPDNESSLVEHLTTLSQNSELRCQMGSAAAATISNWGPKRFADGMMSAVKVAQENRQRANSIGCRLALSCLGY